MNEPSQKQNGQCRCALWIWLICFVAIAVYLVFLDIDAFKHSSHTPPYWQQFLIAAIPATLLLGLWMFVRCVFASWRNFRRLLVGLAIFATLIAIFYAEEDWRGKRAWENCKRELEAKGAVLDWDKFIPPAVSDDQNFFTASTNIALRFVKARNDAESEQARRVQIQYFGCETNPFPVFDNTKPKSKPLVVAEIKILSPGSVLPELRTNHLLIKFNDPAARSEAGKFIQDTIGRSFMSCAGFRFSEFQLSNLPPAQIYMQADTSPSISELEYIFRTDTITNIGRLQIEATGNKGDFRVLLTGVQITAAADYLKWSNQFVPDFDEVRAALKRPYAMIPGDYSQPYLIPIPNFVTMRALSQSLAQRAQCDLFLGQPDQALHELTLVHDVCRILSRPPTGKPITLVEAMINVAITGLYVSAIAEGLQMHQWQEPQLIELQKQLEDINLTPMVAKAFSVTLASGSVRLAYNSAAEYENRRKAYKAYGMAIKPKIEDPEYLFSTFAPRGWLYQNMITRETALQKQINGYDLPNNLILPSEENEAAMEIDSLSKRSPYNFFGTLYSPDFTRATKTLAFNQTLANQAQIVCALERYHLAHGNYPETLDALTPQFMEKIPLDLIGGQPLHYRRTDDGKFLLYSVGWNETDDSGLPGTLSDVKNGDWVWQYPAK
jgi:hypothetical protein